MEEYMRDLRASLLKLQPDEKTFKVLKSNEEIIMRIRENAEIQQEMEYILVEEENMGKIQVLTNKCFSTHSGEIMPTSVCLKKSSISANENGIWSNTEIPKGVRFGPYEGIIAYDQEACDHSLQILEDGSTLENKSELNWLHYVNFAFCKEKQNLIILLSDKQIYYKTITDIDPNTELLAWYGNETETSDKSVDDDVSHKIPLQPYQYEYPNEETYMCDLCGKRYSDISNFKMHQCVQTVKFRYKCNSCGKNFSRRKNLYRHKMIHTGERPYNCIFCEKRFLRKLHLQQHQLLHTGEKPYACDICGKRFALKPYLHKHQFQHVIDKPYNCNICGRKFVYISHLKQHQFVHTGEKPYNCDICRKQFSLKTYLQRHQILHMREKSYKCNLCEKQFSCKGHLKQHQSVHKEKKPYDCKLCGRSYMLQNSFQKHQCLHVGKTLYSCILCEKGFMEKASFWYHLISCVRKFSVEAKLKLYLRKWKRPKPVICNLCEKFFLNESYLKEHLHLHTKNAL